MNVCNQWICYTSQFHTACHQSSDSCNAGSWDTTCYFNSLESRATIYRVSVGHHMYVCKHTHTCIYLHCTQILCHSIKPATHYTQAHLNPPKYQTHVHTYTCTNTHTHTCTHNKYLRLVEISCLFPKRSSSGFPVHQSSCHRLPSRLLHRMIASGIYKGSHFVALH